MTAALAAAQHAAPAHEHNQGHVLIALQNAFYQALHAASLEDGIVATVMGGGDTDTNAAIAGALLGALHGVGAVPAQWRQAILSCRPQRGAPSVHQPRPEDYWPVDALILSERLASSTIPTSGGRESGSQTQSGRTAQTPVNLDGTLENADWMTIMSQKKRGFQRKIYGRNTDGSLTDVRMPARTRFVGAVLGGAIGDALGRPVEGMTLEVIRGQYGRLTDYQKWYGWEEGPIGTITDDTQMTMCVAESLTANGYLDPEDLARRFVAWLPHGRGKGRTTTEAVRRLKAGEPWYRAGDDSSGSAPAMRAAPIGLLHWNNPARLRTDATLSALPTHHQPMGVAGAVAMAAATAWLLTREPGAWPPQEFIAADQASIAGIETEPLPERRDPNVKTTLHDRIGMVLAHLDREPEEVFARLYNGAYVLECLPAALYCFLRSPDDVEAMLLLAVNAGHDADTVAAMAGTLGGALGGKEALPERLLDELEYREDLVALAHRLYGLAQYGDSTHLSETMEGGFGRMIANGDLRVRDIPQPDADIYDILSFGLTFDGYWYWGSNRCHEVSGAWRETFVQSGELPRSLTELRTCLFVLQRAERWNDMSLPSKENDAFARALVAAIRDAVAAGRIR